MINKRFFAALCCVLAICLCGISPALAASEQPMEPSPWQTVMGDIIDFRLSESGEADLQAYIDGTLTATAGTGGENIILALAQSGEQYDFTRYNAALIGWLNNNSVPSASTRQKYALTLMAAGCESGYIDAVLSDSVGQMGIMSNVYGLHLLNNGGQSSAVTAGQVLGDILAAQLPDGGWALYGQSSDVDVTAMVIQALASVRSENADAAAAVDRAVELLSDRQLESGGFASFGEENTESAAQVITALSALGIDCRTDMRFVRSGGSVFDAMLNGQLPDGSFSHTPGGAYSSIATDQALCALTAVGRMERGEGGLFTLDEQIDCTPEGIVYIPYSPPAAEEAAPEERGGADIRLILCAVIIAAGAGVCAYLWFTGKRGAKNLGVVGAVTLILAAVVFCADIQTADRYYGALPDKPDAIGTVTVSIDCSAVADRNADHIPGDGVLLPPTELELCKGETVYDLLVQCAQAWEISVESGSGSYIQGIAHIREQDFGVLSGWVYLVNGQSPSVGCDRFELQPGDRVEWVYSLELGREFDDDL